MVGAMRLGLGRHGAVVGVELAGAVVEGGVVVFLDVVWVVLKWTVVGVYFERYGALLFLWRIWPRSLVGGRPEFVGVSVDEAHGVVVCCGWEVVVRGGGKC